MILLELQFKIAPPFSNPLAMIQNFQGNCFLSSSLWATEILANFHTQPNREKILFRNSHSKRKAFLLSAGFVWQCLLVATDSALT